MIVEEFGGKEASKTMVTLCLKVFGGTNEKLISSLTGLPLEIVICLLKELANQEVVYQQNLGKLRLWRVL